MKSHVISALGGLVFGVSVTAGAVALVDLSPVDTKTAAVLPELAQDFGGAMQLPEGVAIRDTPEAGPSLDVQRDSSPFAGSPLETRRDASRLTNPAVGSDLSHRFSAPAVGSGPTLAPVVDQGSTEPSPERTPTTPPDPPTTTTPPPAHEQLFDVEVSAWVWDQPWTRSNRVAVTVRNTGNFSGPAQFTLTLPQGHSLLTVPEGCSLAGPQLSCMERLSGSEEMSREITLGCAESTSSRTEAVINARLGDALDSAVVQLGCSLIVPPPTPARS